ncbi:hypothetical protein I4U23_016966 [Adineta vaga]|nr:hypothetical protein I4U23_016966 [Adineta vaga]
MFDINLRSLTLKYGTENQFNSIRPQYFPQLEILRIYAKYRYRRLKNTHKILLYYRWPINSSGTVQTNWTGTWHGIVDTYPKGELGYGWNVTWEIGTYPMIDNTCTTWRAIYTRE